MFYDFDNKWDVCNFWNVGKFYDVMSTAGC